VGKAAGTIGRLDGLKEAAFRSLFGGGRGS
jgi:hypothetical protein